MSVPIAGVPGYPVIFRTLLMIIVIAGLGACQTLQNPMAPKQSFNTDDDIKALEKAYKHSNLIDSYFDGIKKTDSEAGGVEKIEEKIKRKARDKFITARLVLINIHYAQFVSKVTANKAKIDTATDILQLGVDLAITVVGGAAIKAALGAASAGITGTRISINKNFFYEKTVPVLITAMNARRKEALIPIIEGMKLDTGKYTLVQAVIDLKEYYFSGTFMGALQSVQVNSGKNEVEADKKIAFLKNSIFAEDESSNRITAFIWKDGKRVDDNSKLIPPIKKNLDSVRAWMVKNKLDGLATQKFLDNPMLRKAREQAIEDINIPKPN